MNTNAWTCIASTWRRGGALIIDCVLMGPFIYVLSGGGFRSLYQDLLTTGSATLPWTTLLTGLAIALLTKSAFLKWKGATPGKLLLKLRVVNARSTDPALSWPRALLRPAFELGHAILSIGLYISFFNRERRHLADWMAGTRVVQSGPERPVKIRWIVGTLLTLMGLWNLTSLEKYRLSPEGLVFTIKGGMAARTPPPHATGTAMDPRMAGKEQNDRCFEITVQPEQPQALLTAEQKKTLDGSYQSRLMLIGVDSTRGG